MFRWIPIALVSASLVFPVLAEAQSTSNSVVTITDADIVGNTSFTSDNTYLLSGLVFVEDGETLTIEAGTVIKGRASGTSGDVAALIVARGGRIFADGTARNPIIFTAEADDVNDPNDILLTSPTASRGLWGGVIILGRASINTATGEGNIEGIDASTEPRGIYGGGRNPNDDDDSGVFRYVSIRHGGTDIGANNEINGLTMGGVGRGTTIEHVEVFYNQDDGFEWFGGTVNTRYLISAFAGDDAFDYDEGFRGEHQFWFSIQDPFLGDHAGEHDGGTDPEDGRPYASPTIMNATYIGRGASSTGDKANNALIFRDNAGGMYFNSVFTEFQGHVLSIEDLDPTRGAQDSKARLEAGDLAFRYNILGRFGAGSSPSDLGGDAHTAALLADASNMNRIADPMLQGISWNRNRGLDPRPGNNSPAWDASKLMEEPRGSRFFADVDYAGAFGTENWAANWSALANLGYFSTAPAPIPPELVEPGVDAPDGFSLAQNSPNPFGMTTNIKYAVSSTSHVLIEVYNLLGQRVATVVNDIRLPGNYAENWDAQHLSSGVYFYRFEATADGRTAYVYNRKMTLLK
ncbi:MAG: T9SS type A sorting domain-containing protein [Gemmatimonadetes bacterium]|nr:T9SS type A sorting domain-containing protein [Gemmatimonadota bacterium]MYG85714.1 T9SS type A sorting domain-containing protein [Gemmatimonadota bacterium]MYJ90130.1 T9SS type A sorting domain-containing protein [Gemmatimonadota bacterium]